MTGAASVTESTTLDQSVGPGSTPRAALQFGPKDIHVAPIPARIAKQMCNRHHYLGSYPASSHFNLGAFARGMLLGVCVIGCGPAGLKHLFEGAEGAQVACLTRFWLDDRLGRNSESRTLSIIFRQLKKHQNTIKAIVAYSDPAAGHTGIVYRASGLLYLGESVSMPKYRLPDGSVHHSRTLSHWAGTHSLKWFRSHGINVELVPQTPKLTYVALLDPLWRDRLTRPVLPYPNVNNEA